MYGLNFAAFDKVPTILSFTIILFYCMRKSNSYVIILHSIAPELTEVVPHVMAHR